MRKEQGIISKIPFEMLEHRYYLRANVNILRKQIMTFRSYLLLCALLLQK